MQLLVHVRTLLLHNMYMVNVVSLLACGRFVTPVTSSKQYFVLTYYKIGRTKRPGQRCCFQVVVIAPLYKSTSISPIFFHFEDHRFQWGSVYLLAFAIFLFCPPSQYQRGAQLKLAPHFAGWSLPWVCPYFPLGYLIFNIWGLHTLFTCSTHLS